MSSPDDGFYNIKRLHLIFALSSAALLGVTAWMLAVDHRRDWKGYQRTFRERLEPWLTEANLRRKESDGFTARDEELQEAVRQAVSVPLDPTLVERFREEVAREAARLGDPPPDFSRIDAAHQQLIADPGEATRCVLLEGLRRFAATARFRLDNINRELRFRRADFDSARSEYEAAVSQELPKARLDALQRRVDAARDGVDSLTARKEESASHHESLAAILGQLTRQEDEARQALADHRASVERMRQTLRRQSPSWAKRLLGLPLIDALGGPVAVEQIWLPELTIDYHFRHVARFDRCITCHLGMDTTQPGSPSEPAWLPERTLTVKLARTWYKQEDAANDSFRDGLHASPKESRTSLEEIYGLALAPRGILDPQAPTIGLVLSRTAAADALLLAGDVIKAIDGRAVTGREEACERLLELARGPGSSGGGGDGQEAPPIELTIRRGVPHPYSAHPRLDLFVGALSPHPATEFGCTICHDGQGSATAFGFASHTPNQSADRRRWQDQYGWSWNDHGGFPMRAARFTQSSCLKCHHEVTDLEPSERFPDPPAPRLLAGYQLVRRNGCFGCHEIKGVLESGERIGPDMRLEPNYHEAALELLSGEELNAQQRQLAWQVIQRPEDPEARRQLAASIRGLDGEDAGQIAVPTASRAMAELLATEHPNPGTLRKVGPSLRDTASRLEASVLESLIADPTRFRPESRMPHLFGLHEHLDGKSLEDARRFEAVEIRAISEYLRSASQPVEPLEAPSELTEPPSAERGRTLWFTQGCAACHKRENFPEVRSVQGPDLTNLGSKITTAAGRRWLVSWVRDPQRHSLRTLMPNSLLELVPLQPTGTEEGVVDRRSPDDPESGVSGTEKPRMTDAAADIVAYLLESDGWEPGERTALIERDLDDLALLHLNQTYAARLARQYLKNGISEEFADRIRGDERELIGPMELATKLRYVGRRTIRARGCFGCHDIPGFEDAQPVGPALSDWGRKRESLLAFHQVHQFLAQRDVEDGSGSGRGGGGADDEYYREAIRDHRREGFLWQKLRAPRSFEYKTAVAKPYRERLLMGRFTLTDEQREAVATFVLALVAAPPANKYVYQPDRRHRAIAEGRKVLDKYGCAECHTLEMERWKFQYDPDKFEDPSSMPDFDFITPRASPEERAASTVLDRRGLGRAEVVGTPRVNMKGELLEDEDEDGNPLSFFTLWEPAVINGHTWAVGGADVMVSQPQLVEKRPPRGGQYARLLYPFVLQQARTMGRSASELEAWGWAPPPLVRQGAMVEPSWLHSYLLDPEPIRPAVVLRMPRYHLSPDEAGKLVDYFAAASGVEFPYSSSPGDRGMPKAGRESQQRLERFDKAMRLLLDRTTYCAKCHLIGDFRPGDVTTIVGPDLERVAGRLRPAYLRRWLANPKSVLPYTRMPVNFPPEGPPMGQELYEGSSLEQLDAVSELLLGYDWYMRRSVPIRGLMGIEAERPTDQDETASGGQLP